MLTRSIENKGLMRNLVFSFVLASSILFSSLGYCAMSDAFSRSYWVTKSGITVGSVNDIIFKYLGTLGYTGSLDDRYRSWLIVQTGLASTLSFTDLLYAYFGGSDLIPDYALVTPSGNYVVTPSGAYVVSH